MTAIDLEDCVALLAYCTATGDPVDRERVRSRLVALPPTSDVGQHQRRALLEAALRSSAP